MRAIKRRIPSFLVLRKLPAAPGGPATGVAPPVLRLARMTWELVAGRSSGSHEAFVEVGEDRGPRGIVAA